MRVLQLGPLYNNHLRRWSHHAAALGCRVFAAGHSKPGRGPVDLDGIVERVAVAPAPHCSPTDESQLRWLDALIESLAPDVIQAHWLPRWGYLAVRSGHPGVVLTPWGSDLYLARGADRDRADEALRDAGRVLARSPHMRRTIIGRGTPQDRISDVDLGVDLARFRPASRAEQARLRGALHLPPKGPMILSLRAPTPLYNLDVALRAFARVRQHLAESATLVLVHGDAPVAPAVAREIQQTEGVRVVGRVSHDGVAQYVRAATIGISIPQSDGSPSSVWEMLAAGVPMVLSDLPQIAERLDASLPVRLVSPSVEATSQAMLDLLRHPRVGPDAARVWAAANVDERLQIARLGEVYDAMRTGSTRGAPQSREPVSRADPRKARATASAPTPS